MVPHPPLIIPDIGRGEEKKIRNTINAYDEAADEVLKAAFGEDADYDGVSCRLEPGISRKQVLVPAITDILESYPQE